MSSRNPDAKSGLFKLQAHGTNVSTELMAGITTFFAMSYILFVNPSILSLTGMPAQAVFLATIMASVVGTLVMGLFANVPYAQAPGMGLNAFFTYTVVFGLGYTWQQALAMVFICGLINILVTVTRIRKLIIHAIPENLQQAIGGGIGIFIAYIGLKNTTLLNFTIEAQPDAAGVVNGNAIVPALANFNNPSILLALIGLLICIILLVMKVKGAILISIIATTMIAIPLGVVNLSYVDWQANSVEATFSSLQTTFGAAFGPEGIQSLFNNPAHIPQILMTILAFSLTDTFDTIGTFIGTGRRTGLFSKADEDALDGSRGLRTRMDKALFADAIATSVGAVFGTSNTTTYVESAAGIGMGGRTGLTSVFTALFFVVSIVFSPLVGIVPAQATAPALILVGVMMMASLKEINWADLEDAIPAFFASVFMALAYSISYGIAAGFIMYTLCKALSGKIRVISPVIWVIDVLFIANFIILAML